MSIKVTHGGFRVRSDSTIGWVRQLRQRLYPADPGHQAAVSPVSARRPASTVGGDYKSDLGNLAGTPYVAQVTSKLQGKFTGKRKAKGNFQRDSGADRHDHQRRRSAPAPAGPVTWTVRSATSVSARPAVRPRPARRIPSPAMSGDASAVSSRLIAKIVLVACGVLAALYLVYLIRKVIGLLLIAVFFALAIAPAVNWLNQRRVPRWRRSCSSTLGIGAASSGSAWSSCPRS